MRLKPNSHLLVLCRAMDGNMVVDRTERAMRPFAKQEIPFGFGIVGSGPIDSMSWKIANRDSCCESLLPTCVCHENDDGGSRWIIVIGIEKINNLYRGRITTSLSLGHWSNEIWENGKPIVCHNCIIPNRTSW